MKKTGAFLVPKNSSKTLSKKFACTCKRYLSQKKKYKDTTVIITFLLEALA